MTPSNKLLPQRTGGEEGVGHVTHIRINNFLHVAFESEEGVRYQLLAGSNTQKFRQQPLLSDIPLHDRHGALYPQNGLISFRNGSEMFLNFFSVLTIPLLGKSCCSTQWKFSMWVLEVLDTEHVNIPNWVGVSIDMWWLRGSSLKLFSTQQNCCDLHVGGRKWSL